MDIVSTNKTIATSVTNTSSKSHNIKAKDCYILRAVLLDIILLLIIAITYSAKQKGIILNGK